jgi:low temperature requirement protein LtrA
MTGAGPAADGGVPEGAGQGPLRVTTLELFFDLVFAFTLTQLTAILDEGLNGGAIVRVLLIFGLLWWMYEGYAWLTNVRPPVHVTERILLLVGMAGFLIVGLAIPRGFSSDGVILGLGYLLVVVVHACLFYRVNVNIVRIVPFNVGSALLVTAAGLVGGSARYPLWVAALVIQLGSPLVVNPRFHFELHPGHLAERHSALLIIALGESVAAIGIGAAALADEPGGAGPRLVASAVLGLALAGSLWWIIFGSADDEQAQEVLTSASSQQRTALALSAFFYGNIPVLLGLVAMAAGVQEAITDLAHPVAGQSAAAAVLAVGAALFVAGDVAIRRLLGTGPVRLRVVATAAALATAAVGAAAGLEAQLALLTVILVVMLLAEGRWAASRPGSAGRSGSAGESGARSTAG